MSALNPAPLLSVDLLSDRNRKPAALLLDFNADATESFVPLAQHEDFRTLASRFPCLIPAGRAAGPLEQSLLDAGCRIVPAASILHAAQLPDEPIAAGIDWIAGHWYMTPPAKPVGNQAASRALALQLVQLVSAEADTREIEAVLRRDPALSYHLLRLVNSLGMGMNRQITSFSQAILILGRAQLRRWLNLMLFSARSGDERSAMLLARVAARARLMELLAKTTGLDKSDQESAFMAGMFSLLDRLLGLPMKEVLRPLKISDSLQSALLQHEGEVGALLALVEAAERPDLPAVTANLHALSLPAEEFNLLTVHAHTWMLDVVRESAGGANG